MASPDEWRRLNIDGLDWVVEIWRDLGGKHRVLCKGPTPSTTLFYSFELPTDSKGGTSWKMIDTILARRVNWYIEKHPERWTKYWGEDGVFTQMGREGNA